MFEAVVSGATDPEIEGVEVVRRAALAVTASDFLEADGYILGTPANLGYISGALKHAFDVSYYQILDSTQGRPFGLYLHGNQGGTEGAAKAVDAITTGLGWVKSAEYVTVSGAPEQGRPRCMLGVGRDGGGGVDGLARSLTPGPWTSALGFQPRDDRLPAGVYAGSRIGGQFAESIRTEQ